MDSSFVYEKIGEKIIITNCPKVLTYEHVNNIFDNYPDVTELELCEGIEVIGDSAFIYNKYLKKITLPSTLKEIDSYAFEECSDLEEIILNEGIVSINNEAFSGCINLKNIKLPSSLKHIGNYAFDRCEKISDVIIPKGIQCLNEGIFQNCIKLKNVSLPNTLKVIEKYAFSKCTNLERITIPEGVKEIKDYVFYNCHKLKEIELPHTINRIENVSYENCRKIKKIIFNTEETTKEIDITNKIFVTNKYGLLFFYDYPTKKYCLFKDGKYIEFDNHIFADNELVNKWLNNRKFTEQDKIKLYYWLNKRFLPHYQIIKNMPLNSIDNFYINNNCKEWGKLVEKSGIKGDENKGSFFKLCYILGVFNEKVSIRDKALNFIEEKIIGEMSEEEIHSRFDGFDLLNNDYNEEYAEFFMKYFNNKNFMKYTYPDGEKVDLLSASFNNFSVVKEMYPSKEINTNRESDILLPKHVINAIKCVYYTNINKGNDNLAEIVGRYGYSQEQFEIIQKLFNIAKSINNEDIKLFIRKDEKAEITYNLLEKDNPLNAVLGNITNCCQVIGGSGESCVKYGMVKPNSKFMTFNYNNTIIGQSWVWYDEISKTICLDNIEVPSHYIENINHNKNIQDAFIKCLIRMARNFIEEMNYHGFIVKDVTIGKGYNDIAQILDKHFYLSKENNILIDYHGYSDAKSQQYSLNLKK